MLAFCSSEKLLGYRILGRLHLLVVYSDFSRYGTTAGQYWLEKAVFRFSAPPPIAHHCVSGVSVLHLALLYPGSVSQRIPVSHVRRWIPVIFSPADFEQVPTRAGFVRFMSISTPSARGSWLKINPPSQIFGQYSGWWITLFNDLIFILRFLGRCFGNAQLCTLLSQSFSKISTRMNFRRMGIRVYISANSGNQKVKQNLMWNPTATVFGQLFGKLYLRS